MGGARAAGRGRPIGTPSVAEGKRAGSHGRLGGRGVAERPGVDAPSAGDRAIGNVAGDLEERLTAGRAHVGIDVVDAGEQLRPARSVQHPETMPTPRSFGADDLEGRRRLPARRGGLEADVGAAQLGTQTGRARARPWDPSFGVKPGGNSRKGPTTEIMTSQSGRPEAPAARPRVPLSLLSRPTSAPWPSTTRSSSPRVGSRPWTPWQRTMPSIWSSAI
jgi:hypothetical protein